MASDSKSSGKAVLKVGVVTPSGPVADQETDAVTAPGRMGELEIFPGHVPFLTELHHGVLTLGEKTAKTVLAVGPGFLSVGQNGEIEILVEQAIAADQVDTEAARAVVNELGPSLKNWKQALEAEYKNLRARHDWAQAQLDAHARIR
jgi:F-type H+-transporting ATPase subunit epsilon